MALGHPLEAEETDTEVRCVHSTGSVVHFWRAEVWCGGNELH